MAENRKATAFHSGGAALKTGGKQQDNYTTYVVPVKPSRTFLPCRRAGLINGRIEKSGARNERGFGAETTAHLAVVVKTVGSDRLRRSGPGGLVWRGARQKMTEAPSLASSCFHGEAQNTLAPDISIVAGESKAHAAVITFWPKAGNPARGCQDYMIPVLRLVWGFYHRITMTI